MSRDILPVLHYGRSVPQTAGIRVITICPGFAGLGDCCFAHDKMLHDSPLHPHSHHRHRHHHLQLYHPETPMVTDQNQAVVEYMKSLQDGKVATFINDCGKFARLDALS